MSAFETSGLPDKVSMLKDISASAEYKVSSGPLKRNVFHDANFSTVWESSSSTKPHHITAEFPSTINLSVLQICVAESSESSYVPQEVQVQIRMTPSQEWRTITQIKTMRYTRIWRQSAASDIPPDLAWGTIDLRKKPVRCRELRLLLTPSGINTRVRQLRIYAPKSSVSVEELAQPIKFDVSSARYEGDLYVWCDETRVMLPRNASLNEGEHRDVKMQDKVAVTTALIGLLQNYVPFTAALVPVLQNLNTYLQDLPNASEVLLASKLVPHLTALLDSPIVTPLTQVTVDLLSHLSITDSHVVAQLRPDSAFTAPLFERILRRRYAYRSDDAILDAPELEPLYVLLPDPVHLSQTYLAAPADKKIAVIESILHIMKERATLVVIDSENHEVEQHDRAVLWQNAPPVLQSSVQGTASVSGSASAPFETSGTGEGLSPGVVARNVNGDPVTIGLEEKRLAITLLCHLVDTLLDTYDPLIQQLASVLSSTSSFLSVSFLIEPLKRKTYLYYRLANLSSIQEIEQHLAKLAHFVHRTLCLAKPVADAIVKTAEDAMVNEWALNPSLLRQLEEFLLSQSVEAFTAPTYTDIRLLLRRLKVDESLLAQVTSILSRTLLSTSGLGSNTLARYDVTYHGLAIAAPVLLPCVHHAFARVFSQIPHADQLWIVAHALRHHRADLLKLISEPPRGYEFLSKLHSVEIRCREGRVDADMRAIERAFKAHILNRCDRNDLSSSCFDFIKNKSLREIKGDDLLTEWMSTEQHLAWDPAWDLTVEDFAGFDEERMVEVYVQREALVHQAIDMLGSQADPDAVLTQVRSMCAQQQCKFLLIDFSRTDVENLKGLGLQVRVSEEGSLFDGLMSVTSISASPKIVTSMLQTVVSPSLKTNLEMFWDRITATSASKDKINIGYLQSMVFDSDVDIDALWRQLPTEITKEAWVAGVVLTALKHTRFDLQKSTEGQSWKQEDVVNALLLHIDRAVSDWCTRVARAYCCFEAGDRVRVGGQGHGQMGRIESIDMGGTMRIVTADESVLRAERSEIEIAVEDAESRQTIQQRAQFVLRGGVIL